MTHHVPSLRRCLTSSVSLMALTFWAQAGHANPADGVVEAGTADITAPDPTTLLINQTSQKAIINWGNFDIGAGELTQFVLPNGSAVTLNRDFSGNPSEILGALKSNGHFYLINPNGILFGTGATVDVAGLVATTHNIRSDDFLNGKLDFNIAGDPSASVINQGNVTIDDLGIAAFVAPHVRNDGAIVARMGKVELASANGFTLDLYGDRLVSFLIENPNQTWYGADGQPVNALVENSGEIIADGGQVVLTAAAARGLVDSVINTDGIIQANSVAQQGGKIILGGGSAGTVKVAGKVSARGENAGEKGGEIIVTGETLTAEQTAILDASGWSGGGKLLFGGDYLGGKATNEDVARFHFTMEDEPVATATAAFLMDGAQLKADALVAGDGGKVVVWSEEATVSAADISARGGSESGNGGFIETSGGYLQVEKAADASAINGAEGTWLLDPLDITIDRASNSNSLWWLNPNEAFNVYTGGGFTADAFRPTGTGSVLSAALIEFALNGGNNVVVTTFGTTGSGKGDIRLKTDITKRAGGNARLSLLADHDVTIDPGVDVRTVSGGLDFEVSAAFGSISGSGVGQIALNGGTMLMVARDGIRFSSAFDMPDNLAVFLNNLGSSSTPRRVDVAFGQDRLRFDYSSSAVELYSGAISLLDTSATGNLLIGFAQGVNAHLYDRSIVSNSNRNWQLGPTVSASVVNSSALNSIPEIEGFTNPYWSFGAEPGAGYTPVIEVSVLRDGTADAGKHIVTAPSGYAALNAYLAGPQPVSPVQQVVQQASNLAPIPAVKGAQVTVPMVQGPIRWTYAGAGPLLGQKNASDTSLYVDAQWAWDTTYKATPAYGNGAYRWAHTCLSTVFAMIEQSKPGGNRAYRIGADMYDASGKLIGNTWNDVSGATSVGLTFKSSGDIPFDVTTVRAELNAGRPVILHGDSANGTGPGGIDDHYMLAVGLAPNGDIIANDPYTATQVIIDPITLQAKLPIGPGSTLTYTLSSFRTVQ